jgi:hypothetical protein
MFYYGYISLASTGIVIPARWDLSPPSGCCPSPFCLH